MTARSWESVQADFPVNENLIWLNNCGTTPMGRPMLETVTRFLDGYSRFGGAGAGGAAAEPAGAGRAGLEKTYPRVKASIYRRLAGLLHAAPEEFALIHNTAEGMNLLSHGFSLSPGEEILLLENEYPSNVYPWEHWREKGVTLRFLPCGPGGAGPSARTSARGRSGETQADFLAAFTAALGPRTRVAALSAVHWCTGMPLPMREIGAICRDRGVELVVDGSQGVGLVDLDPAWGINYMAFSAWKWLLGPMGLGVLFIARDRLDRMRPLFRGSESVAEPQAYLPYQSELKAGADRFAYSTGSLSDWVYCESSLAYLEELGFARVGARILELARHLSQGLRRVGYELASDAYGAESGIVAAAKPGLDSVAAVAALKTRGIIAAERLGRIRLAPHVYLSTAQLDQAVEVLGSL